MKTDDPKYIHALNIKAFTPFYDPLLKWIMKEEIFKRRLIEQAAIQSDHHVLDLGCGTGTLTVMIKQTMPSAEVIGMDGDKDVLAIARAKAEQAGVEIKFDFGLASELPYSDGVFDRVLSSLVIHHLTINDKLKAFNEVFRVLASGGEFHIVDFGEPKNFYGWLASRFIRHMERANDNVEGLIPEFLKQAGFAEVKEAASFTTLFGSLTMLVAYKN